MGRLCASVLYDGVSFSVAGERRITLAAVHHVCHLQKPAAYYVLQLRKTYAAYAYLRNIYFTRNNTHLYYP